uniref:Uncharacterized protein n=1 Tax=Steinernema glaseri TaxID=37863 RepID=A0A1I7Y3B4_9BILA
MGRVQLIPGQLIPGQL